MNKATRALRAIAAAVIMAACAFLNPAEAYVADREQHIDSIGRLLSRADNPSDSILLLYHIFDLNPYSERPQLFDSIYNVSRRAGDVESELEILRQKALFYNERQDTTTLRRIIDRVESYPRSVDADETRVFVNMLHSSSTVYLNSPDKQLSRISDLIGSYSLNPPLELTDRIINLYTICGLIASVTHGEMLEKYVDQLDQLIEELPTYSGCVRSLFFTRCAIAFSRNERYYRAADADRNQLAILDRLEASYHEHGRKFCDYNRRRFICYLRLLGNFPELSRAEITSYYNTMRDILAADPDIAAEFGVNRRMDIFYLMASKQYKEAIATIKKELRDHPSTPYRPRYIRYLMEASKAIDDKPTQLEAALDLNEILNEQLHSKAIEKTRELQIVYDVNGLRSQNAAENLEVSRARRRMMQIAFTMACITVLILVIAIIVLSHKFRQSRSLTRQLAESNRQLADEREKLLALKAELIKAGEQAKIAEQQKSNFINNMSHEVRTPLAAIVEYTQLIVDCIPENQKRFLSRFANIIELNARLLFSLVSDVLDIAALERTEMTVQKNSVDLDNLCQMAVDSVRPLLHPGVEVNFVRGHKNMEIHSDAQRITQILTNLLSNGIKFTEHGSVTLNYEAMPDGRGVRFTVTDTGIGIPAGQEEAIFENFHQLDSSVQGSGMGLYIVRLISRLLGATVKVDTTYRKGARFIFDLPL